MGWYTQFFRRKLNDHAFNVTPYTPPATVDIVLLTTPLADTANTIPGGSEMSGAGYTALTVNFDSSVFSTSDATGTVSNKGTLQFAAATADYPALAGWAVRDGVNVLLAGALSGQPLAGQRATIGPGQLTATLAKP